MRRILHKIGPAGVLTVLVAGVGAALFLSAMRDTLAKAASRDAVADLGDYGLVTIRLTTEPNPPQPTGTVRLAFMSSDARRRPMALDGLAFVYARQCDGRPAGAGQAQPMPDSDGMWMAAVQFPDAGNWCLLATARKGAKQATLRFTFDVKPAQ